jgi:hypothetical protein
MSSFGFGNGSSGSWDTPPTDPTPAPGGRSSGQRAGQAPSAGWDETWSDGDGSSTRSGGGSADLWLGAALLLTLVAIASHFITDTSTLAAIGWFLGGPVAIAALGVFVSADTRRRADPWHRPSGLADWGRRLVVVLALVAVALNAWRIADHLSRGHW